MSQRKPTQREKARAELMKQMQAGKGVCASWFLRNYMSRAAAIVWDLKNIEGYDIVTEPCPYIELHQHTNKRAVQYRMTSEFRQERMF